MRNHNKTLRLIWVGLFCALVAVAPLNVPEASAMMWRADIGGLEQKQTGVMKNAGRILYTPLQVFGGTGVLLGDHWFLTAKHAVSAWKPGLLTIELPGLDDQKDLDGKDAKKIDKYKVTAVHLHPSEDLALLELASAPAGATNLVLNIAADEAGKRVWLGGFGAAGPAGKVQAAGSFHAGHNRIRSVKGKRAIITFDRPVAPANRAAAKHAADVPEADEAFPAMLDSGSPVFLERGQRDKAPGNWQLMGIVVTATNSGKPNYGDRSGCVRLSQVRGWLNETTGAP